ncbi:hypothetical protein WA588_003565 [Blastocystis sp. NMH]
MSGRASFSADDIRDLLSKIAKLEENYRLKQMECATEVEKHKKSLNDLDNLKKEVSLLVEEKMRLCEKIGSLTESCALKDHLNETMKKDIEKRMTELHVLEQRLDEETESYRARREDFKRQIDEINTQLKLVLDGCDEAQMIKEVEELKKENQTLREKLNTNSVPAGEHSPSESGGSLVQENIKVPSQLQDVEANPVVIQLRNDKEQSEAEVKRLQKEFEELNDYLNKLETSYNQSLEYINHLESIIAHCDRCSKSRNELIQAN